MNLFIATPAFNDEVYVSYASSVLRLENLLISLKIPYKISVRFGGNIIQRARDALVEEFLATDCTHLFFIDADIGFQAQDVLSIVKRNHLVCGATYPFKRYPIELVPGVPTGFLCIQRETFRLLEHAPYFNTMIHGKRYLSEDYAFAIRCQAKNILPVIVKDVQLTHTGTHTFASNGTKI
jgi:hypothetical protein